MPSDPRRARGDHGERLAEQHLLAAGYRVLERNFRTRHGELDLVVADARALVFCEVKTRAVASRAGPAGPLDSIGPGKRRKLRLMAGQWLAARADGGARPLPPRLRFDAIGVTVDRSGALLALEHVEDAF